MITDRNLYKALKCVFSDEGIIVDIMRDKGATLLPYATITEWLINEWNHAFINSIKWTIKAVLIGLENADIHVIETPYGVLVYSNYSALPTNILGGKKKMTTLELTINSRGKVYNIDVSDWGLEKWEEWHHTTETWGHNEWFKFTRYLDSVNNDVWDAIHRCRPTIKFMGKTPADFCYRAMTLLGYPSIFKSFMVTTYNYDMLIALLKSELSEKHYEVVKEDDTNIYYLVKR